MSAVIFGLMISDWKEIALTLVALIGCIPITFGVVSSLREFRLKLQAEARQAKSAEIEQDVALLSLFAKMMDLAHARAGNHVSERAVEKLLEKLPAGATPKEIEMLLSESVISLPVGSATQDSAIAAIWALGKRHEQLRPIALQSLKSISSFKTVAIDFYNDLLEESDGKYKPLFSSLK